LELNEEEISLNIIKENNIGDHQRYDFLIFKQIILVTSIIKKCMESRKENMLKGLRLFKM